MSPRAATVRNLSTKALTPFGSVSAGRSRFKPGDGQLGKIHPKDSHQCLDKAEETNRMLIRPKISQPVVSDEVLPNQTVIHGQSKCDESLTDSASMTEVIATVQEAAPELAPLKNQPDHHKSQSRTKARTVSRVWRIVSEECTFGPASRSRTRAKASNEVHPRSTSYALVQLFHQQEESLHSPLQLSTLSPSKEPSQRAHLPVCLAPKFLTRHKPRLACPRLPNQPSPA
ncbi:hypothetical protein IWX90DRAFT_425690 [Phyllosticta citrichinensis]|uniref:Uncharacterized protein n=1 Tax=Phyllosticta citrichinensis TaxID=1130410 RepID=A0ABR1Y468_9PEZI